MVRPSTHASMAATAVVAAVASLAGFASCSAQRSVILGFWFEPVTHSSSRLGGPLETSELATIVSVARGEITHAFDGLRVTVSERHDARYRVRVVQHLRDPRFRSDVEVAGSSRAVSMFGGDGAVNFTLLAAYAESYAPADADRARIVTAIGRGIGRAAVHEFVHQLLGPAGFSEAQGAQTYEHGSAARREQYFGELRWGDAWPALDRRFGASGRR